MAVIARNQRALNKRKMWTDFVYRLPKYLTIDYVKFLVFDPCALSNGIISALIILAEFFINFWVINRIPYTEIDWKAYMQECEGFINGTTNYAHLRGDTGPLVYPGGFVYAFSLLYYVTSHGANVRLAQYIFAVIYLIQLWLVLRLYTLSKKVPPFALAVMAFTSYRVHSIYVLRLFNDPVAIVFLYAALNLFIEHHWKWGSVLFSLAVGIKMNVLLFAPALLAFYIINLGYAKTLYQLTICGLVQLVLGAPFLLTYPLAYLKGSFDLGRIFEHKWTVNYRFLPKPIFENKYFHLTLLGAHLLLLLVFLKPTLKYFRSYMRLRALQSQLEPQLERRNRELEAKKPKINLKAENVKPKTAKSHTKTDSLNRLEQEFLKSFENALQKSAVKKPNRDITSNAITNDSSATSNRVQISFDHCVQLALLPFFLCNFIGITCARSLHYQFYVWYFHSLPYLLWSTPYSNIVRLTILGLLEYCWNTYPSTELSSYALHLCHFTVLYGVARYMYGAQASGKPNKRA